MVAVSQNAEREVGKALVNIFYLTIVGVFVTYTLDNSDDLNIGISLVYICMAMLSLSLGIILISHADSREKEKKEHLHTEVRKGIFHIQNAEIKK